MAAEDERQSIAPKSSSAPGESVLIKHEPMIDFADSTSVGPAVG